jgi:uncharacterized protein
MSDTLQTTLGPAPPTAELAAPEPFAPITATQRLVNLDFVRGVALLGILLVNVAVMFGPIAALTEPSFLARQSPADRAASLLVLSLCQTKFVSLFSLLFGYGLFGQIEKAAARGRSPGWFTCRRLGVLALFGLVHGLAVWYGDILLLYACLGGWLLLARGARARSLLIVAGCLLAFTLFLRTGLEAINAVGRDLVPATPAATEPYRGLEAMWRAGLNPGSPVWIDAEIAAYRDGPWADAQLFRSVEWLFNQLSCLFFLGWLALGMFFLGAALYRARFFAPEQRPLRLRVLRICLPLGLAVEGLAAVFFWGWPPTNRWAWFAGGVIQQAGLFFLPLGYLAGLALLADRLPAWLRNPVASAGRMSLTVYLLESVLATALAYHWGLGWFGVGAATQVAIAVCIWLALVAFSHAWLCLFEQGPTEWLWRRLAYGRPARPESAISPLPCTAPPSPAPG